MPILNYTTQIAAQKTAGEIQAILATKRKGGRDAAFNYSPDCINALPTHIESA